MRRLLTASLIACATPPAYAQRASENAIASADDAFGSSVGTENTGIYNENDIRGFSPTKAGNARIDGIYFDQVTFLSTRIRASAAMRVGFAALDYPFPAPTGIVDYTSKTSGNELAASAGLTLNGYGGRFEELDFQIPVIKDHLSIATGIGHGRLEFVDGATITNYAFGFKPTVRFRGFEFSAWYGAFINKDAHTRPLITTSNPFLPSLTQPGEYLGQDWAINRINNNNHGATLKAQLSDALSLRGGFFRSEIVRLANFTEVFAVRDSAGLSSHLVLADPHQRTYSDSWEGQIAWRVARGKWTHRFLLGLRGRDRHTETGGSDFRSFGQVVLGNPDPEEKPSFVFSPVNAGNLVQRNYMLGYLGKLAGVGQINFGVQQVSYRARFRDATAITTTTASPLIYNVSVELLPSRMIALFAGHVRGLEDNGTAPESAANRNEQLPATLTTQTDAGVRIKFAHSQFVVSMFELRKPYFTFGAANRFDAQGSVRHRGAEFSFSGQVGSRLSVVAGAVLMSPVVTGPGRDLGLIGRRPTGTPSSYIRLDANYRTPLLDGLTATASLIHASSRAVSAQPFAALNGNQLMIAPHTTLDLGMRHRFKLGSTPVSARFTVQNIFDTKSWRVLASNTLQQDDRRRIYFSIGADF